MDPFEDIWPGVQKRLVQQPRLRAVTLFGRLHEKYPERFLDSQGRTLERRVQGWHGKHGPNLDVIFPQKHYLGRLTALDFTSVNTVGITIARQPFICAIISMLTYGLPQQ